MPQLPPIGGEVTQAGAPLEAGNIDLSTRPRVRNADGSTSTVRSMSFEQDGKEILVPTVVNGKVVSDAEAIANYKKTGQHLGIFATTADATAFAQQLHEREARKLELPPVGGEIGQARTPDFRTTNEPPSVGLRLAAGAKDVATSALNALPGAGAIVGGVLATPETLGAGSIAGAAVGAGIGRGLRDLITEGLGLERPSSPASKAGRIALDTSETAAAAAILPGLWEAIKTPGKTVSEVVQAAHDLVEALPPVLRPNLTKFLPRLPPGIGKAPASILERPAWQAWGDHLPGEATAPPAGVTPPPGRTGTSMQPAAMPSAPVAAPVTAPAVNIDTAIAQAKAAHPPVAVDEFTAARAARQAPAAGPDQRSLNEAALAARRSAYQASQTTAPAAAAPPAGPIVAASGKMQLTAPEFTEFTRLSKRMPLPDALQAVLNARELAARLGGASAAEVAKAVAHRGTTGAW